MAHLHKLQNLVEQRQIPFGKANLPAERGPLENILDGTLGEGKVVSLSGFIVNARYGNTDTGDSANCNQPGSENNDLQFNISQSSVSLPKAKVEADKLLCETALVEISPHFRPKGWELAALTSLQNKHLPVRITGQLYFDASHSVCKNGVPPPDGSPARATLWEIRPVYGIEVCSEKDVDLCGDGSWKRLALSSASRVIRRAISKTTH